MSNINKEIYIRCLLQEKVKLVASQINKTYKDTIVAELKNKIEGKCTKHGFIKKDSIEISTIQDGTIEMANLNGNVVFNVKFYAEVCNPVVGSIIKCRVSNINKFGILAEVKPILEIIIAKNSVNIKSDVDLETIQIGDDILVEVMGKKYELGDVRISIIGRVVSSPTSAKSKKMTLVHADDDDGEDAEDDVEHFDDEEEDVDKQDEDGDGESESQVEIDDDADVDVEDDDDESKKIKGFFESDSEEEPDAGGGYDMFEGSEEGSEDGYESD